MSLTLRLTAAVVLVLLIHGGVVLMRQGGVPTHVLLPPVELEEMPTVLGEWTGTQLELDPRLFDATEAEAALGYVYQRPVGPPISVHIAVVTNWPELGIRHRPEVCYEVAGYRMSGQERRYVRVGDMRLPVQTSTWHRGNEQLQILHWYQFGHDVVFDNKEFRAARRQYWGQSAWPPVIKVLLHVSTSNPRAARDELEHFAVPLYEWTRKLNPGE